MRCLVAEVCRGAAALRFLAVWAVSTCAPSAAALAKDRGEELRSRGLVAFSRQLAESGELLEAAAVARLAAVGCEGRCRGEALVAGAEALLWARQPYAAAEMYKQALDVDALRHDTAARARVLFCAAMAAQEANRPRACASYLHEARATASGASLPLAAMLDVRCLTPQLGRAAAVLAAAGPPDANALLDQVAAVSANFTASLDLAAAERASGSAGTAFPAFLPVTARGFWSGGRGGSAWNQPVLEQLRLPETTPVRKAVSLWHEWGVVSVERILPEEFCRTLERYFSQVVGPSSTMAFETGLPVAAHSGEELVLRDFILTSLSEAGGDVALALAALLDYLSPLLHSLALTPGTVVGLGQAAAYAGAALGPIRPASAAVASASAAAHGGGTAPAAGAVAVILLTDVPYRHGGPEVWPGAHLTDWETTAWSGLLYEDVSQDGRPMVTASVQIAGRRGDCFVLHPALPVRPGPYPWQPDDGLPSTALVTRWLEVSLAAADAEGAARAVGRGPLRLHPELRARTVAYPLGELPASGQGAAAAAAAGGPDVAAAVAGSKLLPPPPPPVAAALALRLATARRLRIEGASAVAEALGLPPEARRGIPAATRARAPSSAASVLEGLAGML